MFSDKDNYCFYVLCSIEDVFHQLLHQATMSYAVSKIPKGIHMVLKLDLVTLLQGITRPQGACVCGGGLIRYNTLATDETQRRASMVAITFQHLQKRGEQLIVWNVFIGSNMFRSCQNIVLLTCDKECLLPCIVLVNLFVLWIQL